MDNADFPVVLFSVFVLKQRRWWWLHLRCSKMLKPKFLKEKLSFWRWTNVDREVAACWTGWEGERRREVTPWQRPSGTGLSCAGVHLMCIDKGSGALDWIDQASYHQVSEHPGRQPAQPPLRPHHQRLWSRRVWTHRPVTEVVVKGADVPPI